MHNFLYTNVHFLFKLEPLIEEIGDIFLHYLTYIKQCNLDPALSVGVTRGNRHPALTRAARMRAPKPQDSCL